MKILANATPFIVVGAICATFLWGYSERTDVVGKANRAYIERDYPKAIRLYEEGDGKLNEEEWIRLADAYARVGKEKESLSIYATLEANDKFSGDETAQVYLAKARDLYESGKIEDSVEQYQKVIDKADDMKVRVETKKEMGRVISEHPSEETASLGVKSLLEVLDLPTEKKNPDIPYQIGTLIDYLGDQEYALKYWEMALSIDPKHTQSQEEVGFALIERKEFERAMSVFKGLLSQDSRNGRAYAGLGALEEATGNEGQAVSLYNQAISLNPKGLEPRLGLARIYLEKGDKTAAIDQFYQIVRVAPDSQEAREAREKLKELTPKLSPVPATQR